MKKIILVGIVALVIVIALITVVWYMNSLRRVTERMKRKHCIKSYTPTSKR